MLVGLLHNEGIQAPHLLLQQAHSIFDIGSAQAIAAH